jgi:hypothetical protein
MSTDIDLDDTWIDLPLSVDRAAVKLLRYGNVSEKYSAQRQTPPLS